MNSNKTEVILLASVVT